MSEKVDFLALLVGPPGHGKTSLAMELALERLRAGRWVLVQDAAREWAPRICVEFPAPPDFLRSLSAGQPVRRGASFPVGADQILELGRSLGAAWNQSAGHVTQPICLVVNEASSSEESGPTWVGRLADQVINQRRHLGLELIYCLQRPTQLSSAFWDAATYVAMFRQTRADRVDALERAVGVERGALRSLLSLDRHQYLRWTPAGGLA
jgi:hypothetical protein